MNSTEQAQITIQTSPESVPAVPPWLGEVAVIAHALRRLGVLATIEKRMRFARRRFGHYDLIDFVVVLLGYAISGESTLEAFYERVQPFAAPFMALFGRERLPHRSARDDGDPSRASGVGSCGNGRRGSSIGHGLRPEA